MNRCQAWRVVSASSASGVRLRQIAQRVAVQRGELGALLDEAVEPRELVDAERRLEIGEVVLEARHDRLVADRRAPGVARGGVAVDAVEAQPPHALGDLRIGRRHHAALGGGEVLGRVEAEAGRVRPGADPPAAVLGARSVCGVLDHDQAVALRERREPVEIARLSREVDRQDRARARRDRTPRRSRA